MACRLLVWQSIWAYRKQAAQNHVDIYFARYPGVKNYMEKTRIAGAAIGICRNYFWATTLYSRY